MFSLSRLLKRIRGTFGGTAHSGPRIAIEPLESEHGFRIGGELDLVTVDVARAALEPELRGTVILDLSGLEFMDDSGLGLIVGSVRQLGAGGGTLVLRNVPDNIFRIFEITGLTALLTIERSREA